MNFDQDGVAAARRLFDSGLVIELGEELSDFFNNRIDQSELVVDRRRNSHALERVFNPHMELPHLERLWTHTRLLDEAASLLRVASVTPFYTQAILKYPSRAKAGVIGWHSDYAYWKGARRPNLITAWVPFQSTTFESGTLLYVAGSHKWDDAADFKGFNADNLAELAADVVAEADIGDTYFHHCLTLHGSSPNLSEKNRLALAIHLIETDLLPVDLELCHHSLSWLGDGHA